jgi:hypothetical protein
MYTNCTATGTVPCHSLTTRPVIGISGTGKFLGLINYIYRLLYYSQTAIHAYNVSKFILLIINRDYFFIDRAFDANFVFIQI